MMGHDQQEANVTAQQLQQAINVTQMFYSSPSFQHLACNQLAPPAAIEPHQQEASLAALRLAMQPLSPAAP
ncbi:TPA: hypothetical protein ACH3X3_014618 [Trebouxia sp. C0006]|jgi:hypothetical protein